jgi:hypothetical protein
MKYKEFIENCKIKNYSNLITQKHHILPVSSGGTNDIENLVLLSIHDHFWAHVYYAQETGKCKTAPSWLLHTYCAKETFTEQEWNEAAEIAYELQSEAMQNLKRRTGWHHSEETKQKMREKALGNTRGFGRKDSQEVKEKRANSLTGRKNTEEAKQKMREAAKLRKRTKHSEETKQKIRLSNIGQKRSLETREKQSLQKKGKSWKLINGKRVWSSKIEENNGNL